MRLAQSGAFALIHVSPEEMSVVDQVAQSVQQYVVGFAFDRYDRVALIKKNRPAWQAGRLNGIGGHVEPGEDPDAAMRREFREETGADLGGWEPFVVMEFPAALITFYRLRVESTVLDGLSTTTDEEVVRLSCSGTFEQELPAPKVSNLSWLLPLALYTVEQYEPIRVLAR